MEKFNWTKNLKTNIVVLKIVGLWPLSCGSYKKYIYDFYRALLVVLILVINAVFQTINIIFFIDDLLILTSSLFMVITLYLVTIKYYCFTKKLSVFKQLLKTLQEEEMFQPKNSWQKNLCAAGISFWKKIYVMFWILVVITVFFWTSFPILDRKGEERLFLFPSWYPYNEQKSPLYEITYLFQTSCIWFMALVSVCTDTSTTALMTYIGVQCDLLCDSLKHLGYPTENNEQIDIHSQLIQCIKQHKKILNFANQCHEFFNLITFGQFATSAVCIGLTMFQLTIVIPMTSEFYCLVFFGTSITVQMFQFCWFANEVQIKSSEIPSAAFHVNFIDTPMKVKKNLIIFIARTQKSINISVLNLFVLSLATFIKIIQTAWSYLTMLRQVSEDE